jgi:hypothetical protein
MADVRYWHKADISVGPINVRFWTKADVSSKKTSVHRRLRDLQLSSGSLNLLPAGGIRLYGRILDAVFLSKRDR